MTKNIPIRGEDNEVLLKLTQRKAEVTQDPGLRKAIVVEAGVVAAQELKHTGSLARPQTPTYGGMGVTSSMHGTNTG